MKKLEPKPSFHDDFDATIIKSRFGFEEGSINSDIPSLIFSLEEKNGDISHVAFSTGSGGWRIVEDGRRVEHQVRRNVVRGSMYGFFQVRVLVGLKVDMRGRGTPTEADTWTGLIFHWKIEEISPVVSLLDKNTGKIIQLMPTKFLGGYEFSTTTPEEELIQALKLADPNISSRILDKLRNNKPISLIFRM
jgi:hypothetical protein